ncbi:hypothetical protein BJ875DRAFT_42465 [Amylocarpus encephaloides]|uniref:Uncharacterized protein n=1 Tax=Amylocarpus encephaloides TaxID=45428 RepID=A0A9P7YHI3_9HELO|nr:hypothetical protein BJ875DRAFT_42465 [Amylocarpus encephaloides]
MRVSWFLSLPTVLSVVSALAIERRDADFLSVRTKMHKDMSGRRGDPVDKYFRRLKLILPGVLYSGTHADRLILQMRACR